MMATVPFSIVKKKLLANPEFRSEYAGLEEEFALAAVLIEARTRAGMSQKDMAEAMGISQPAVATIESGKSISLRTLKRYAKATGSKLEINLPAA